MSADAVEKFLDEHNIQLQAQLGYQLRLQSDESVEHQSLPSFVIGLITLVALFVILFVAMIVYIVYKEKRRVSQGAGSQKSHDSSIPTSSTSGEAEMTAIEGDIIKLPRDASPDDVIGQKVTLPRDTYLNTSNIEHVILNTNANIVIREDSVTKENPCANMHYEDMWSEECGRPYGSVYLTDADMKQQPRSTSDGSTSRIHLTRDSLENSGDLVHEGSSDDEQNYFSNPTIDDNDRSTDL